MVEFLDDIQRMVLEKKPKKHKSKLKKNKIIFSKENIKLIKKKSNNPIVILGYDYAQTKNSLKLLKLIKNLNIKISCTWGGQKIQKYLSKKENFVGIMGNHNPGIANKEIKNSDLLISLGCSCYNIKLVKITQNLLQNAKIIYVNNDLSESVKEHDCNLKRLKIVNLRGQ